MASATASPLRSLGTPAASRRPSYLPRRIRSRRRQSRGERRRRYPPWREVACMAQERGSGKIFVWGDEWVEYDSEWKALPEITPLWVNIFEWITPVSLCTPRRASTSRRKFEPCFSGEPLTGRLRASAGFRRWIGCGRPRRTWEADRAAMRRRGPGPCRGRSTTARGRSPRRCAESWMPAQRSVWILPRA